ncbi:MAG: ribose 5-phosphate isomerase A [Anaerolineales bacterium]|nr:ribose 5-phosphate isomerase A [Anaerolineales bacterium]
MNLKQQAAHYALQSVRSGMVLGLGSGSTTAYFVDMLGEAIQQGKIDHILAVPTSEATTRQAQKLGIILTSLDKNPVLDLAVDGADEVDPQLNLIKGLGRACLREKVVEIHADQFIIVVDESKIVQRLGTRGPLPVEILPFEAQAHVNWLNTLGCRAEFWFEDNGEIVVSDNGNYLVKCFFENGIPDVYQLNDQLAKRPGILEHGLFLDMATQVVVAGENGINTLEAKR